MVDRVYEGMLQDRFGLKQIKEFRQLNEAIAWLVREFEVGEDGNAVLGEIRLQGALIWRKGVFRSR
jgi:hypothetical protein